MTNLLIQLKTSVPQLIRWIGFSEDGVSWLAEGADIGNRVVRLSQRVETTRSTFKALLIRGIRAIRGFTESENLRNFP